MAKKIVLPTEYFSDGTPYREWVARYRELETPSQTLSMSEWVKYRDILKALSDKAAEEFRNAVWNIKGRWRGIGLGKIPRNELIDYAYALITKYSEGSSAVACEFYDLMAELQGANVPPAVPADTPEYSDVARTVNGTINQTTNPDAVSSAVGRLVKQTGQDTTLRNAIRDGSEVAWIPSGDTCAFCLMLASNGWQPAGRVSLKKGHAQHIHANCDCAYAVRFASNFEVAGFNDGEKYREMYDNAEGVTPAEKLNAMRREFYAENSEEINEQKRSAYEKRKEREESEAEELDV